MDPARPAALVTRGALRLPLSLVQLLHMFKFWPKYKMRGFRPPFTIQPSDLEFPYHAEIEEEATRLARTYGIPSISMRDALFRVVRDNATDGLRLNDLMCVTTGPTPNAPSRNAGSLSSPHPHLRPHPPPGMTGSIRTIGASGWPPT